MVVRKAGPWTLVLDPRAHLFRTAHPDSAANQLRLPVTPQSTPFTMKGVFDPADDHMKTFALIRIGPDTFRRGLYDEQGAIYEVLRSDLIFEFKRMSCRATSLEMRGASDELEGRATRP